MPAVVFVLPHQRAISLTRRRLKTVRTIHFCGGEPTIHPALAELLKHVHTRGGKNRLTTNAIVIPNSLLPVLRTTATEVKVSLHGDQDHHNSNTPRATLNVWLLLVLTPLFKPPW